MERLIENQKLRHFLVIEASYLIFKAILLLPIFKSTKVLMFFINLCRLVIATISCALVLMDKEALAFSIFLTAFPTYMLDIPKIKFKISHQNKQLSAKQEARLEKKQQKLLEREQKHHYKFPHPRIEISIVSDTFLVYPVLFAFLSREYLNVQAVFLYMTGQIWFQMYPILKFKRNRNFMVHFIEILAYFALYEAFERQYRLANLMLLTCFVIQFVNFLFCSIPKNWYANCLSIINLLCGIAAILALLTKQTAKPRYEILAWVLVGQFFDLFDGRAAERFGSTPKGEMFDDAADFTSFGIASGILVYKCMRETFGQGQAFAAGCAFIYTVSVAYRLVRFVMHKHAAGQMGGVRVFEGLPSPGTSAMMLCTTCLIQSFKLKFAGLYAQYERHIFLFYCGFMGLVCYATDSYTNYAHFGRVFSNKRLFNSHFRVLVSIAFVYFSLQSIIKKDCDYIVCYISLCMFLYLVSPWTMKAMYTRIKEYEEQVGASSDDENYEEIEEKEQ